MKIERSKDWWISHVASEGDAAVGAGLMAFDPRPSEEKINAAAEESRLAFGRFVSLMRRRLGLTVEQLAVRVELDASELLLIEDSLRPTPEPRTVYQLARFFKVSQKALMQLAGLTLASDMTLREEAVRFAARSESIQKLTTEELAALNAFIVVLSKQDRDLK